MEVDTVADGLVAVRALAEEHAWDALVREHGDRADAVVLERLERLLATIPGGGGYRGRCRERLILLIDALERVGPLNANVRDLASLCRVPLPVASGAHDQRAASPAERGRSHPSSEAPGR